VVPLQNLDDLLTSGQPTVATSTASALQGLDLGGKTAEAAAAEAEILKAKQEKEEKAEAAAQAEELAKQDSSMPISRKDTALNSLVNFDNLK